MKIQKQHQIVLVPTDKPDIGGLTKKGTNISGPINCKHSINCITENMVKREGYTVDLDIPQHLYILSDEEIKEGDWFLEPNVDIRPSQYKSGMTLTKDDRKIIATTDTSLLIEEKDKLHTVNGDNYIKLPKPTNQFIQQWIDNGYPEFINVDYESYCTYGDNCPSKGAYLKQDLCNIEYKLKISSDNTINCSFIENNKLYTKDEVIKLTELAFNVGREYSDNYHYSDFIKENL